MGKITEKQVEGIFDLGKQWLADEITRTHEAERAATELDLNRVSAFDLLQVLKAMIAGERFTRSISAPAAEIYFARIKDEFGEAALDNAIASADLHIAYYESIRPVTLHKFRKVVENWRLPKPQQSASKFFDAFDAEVEKAKALTTDERRNQLPPAGDKPKSTLVQSRVFVRSAVVVAEVLARANGVCERCQSAAPFISASTGEPYLEVHHRVTLASGGDDTVENALALCPNCHREVHFGKVGGES